MTPRLAKDPAPWIAAASAALGLLSVTSLARADGIDIAWYLSRVPGWHRAPARAVLLLLGLMVVNYIFNLLVIGLPAMKMGASKRRVAGDIVGFTFLGQVADRLGAIAGPLIGFVVVDLCRVGGRKALGLGMEIGILLNLVLAGLFVGFLVRWYMRRRWSLVGRRVAVMACIAGVLTNPVWGAIAAMTMVPDADHPRETDPRHEASGWK